MIKNSITLTLNITTSLTIFRIIGGKTTSAYYPIFKVAKTNKFHDRYIVIDNKKMYYLGSRLKIISSTNILYAAE